uniref:Uncharacterized protein n=1 Tax=Rhizophora mucronata TaxID=61149 RepID=A0A2P2M5Z2_RHIMU
MTLCEADELLRHSFYYLKWNACDYTQLKWLFECYRYYVSNLSIWS